ncbi:STAS domain-containing protein [Leptolyngbya sp. FACHB-261]|uniref:STAS domain-containing protein n=1 Tax=Leptolyngbya sp. FACHB-261 TaxID=2692806 RepID=UPI0016824905|nr:STAS domain-containing protein [Leptolyngbya sp. FACHB-261]MBD2103731.1 STAS domain-containing protein [Leptolyngbya sp. FACHB-261]
MLTTPQSLANFLRTACPSFESIGIHPEIAELWTTPVARVSLPVRADITVVRDIRQQLKQALEPGAHDLLIDCSQVRFIDSSCIAAIMKVVECCEESQGKVVLFGANAHVQYVLYVLGLSEVLPNFADEATALSALQTPSYN